MKSGTRGRWIPASDATRKQPLIQVLSRCTTSTPAGGEAGVGKTASPRPGFGIVRATCPKGKEKRIVTLGLGALFAGSSIEAYLKSV